MYKLFLKYVLKILKIGLKYFKFSNRFLFYKTFENSFKQGLRACLKIGFLEQFSIL